MQFVDIKKKKSYQKFLYNFTISAVDVQLNTKINKTLVSFFNLLAAREWGELSS